MDHNGTGVAIQADSATLFIQIEYVRAKVRPYSTYGLNLAQRNAIIGSHWPSPFQRPTRGSWYVKHAMIHTSLCIPEHTETGKCLSMYI